MFTESLGYGRPRAQHTRAEETADLLKLSGQPGQKEQPVGEFSVNLLSLFMGAWAL